MRQYTRRAGDINQPVAPADAIGYARTCQFIIGEGEFCGEKTKLKSSYCEHHHGICYVPRGEQKEGVLA